MLKKIAIGASFVGACAVLWLPVGQAIADEASNLRNEVAAQRAQLDAQQQKLEAQRLRLEALEKKLDERLAAQQPAQPAASQQAASQGDGIKEAIAKVFTTEGPQPSAERLVAATNDVGSGITFQLTPADSVTLYGLLDVTLSNVTNADTIGNHKTGYQVSWFSGNRWGLTGKHALAPNVPSVIFKLESEFDIRTGEEDTPGVLFNRDAWVGFESDQLGKITFGRQNALARDYSGIYGDPYGAAVVSLEEGGYSNTNNFKQLIFYAASATGTRIDNGVVWKKRWGNFVTGLAYQFGNVPGQFARNTTETAAFGYNGGLFNLAGFYDRANINTLVHKSYSIGGNVLFGPLVRVNAGYFHYTSEQPIVGERKDNAYTLSAKFTPAGPWDYEVGYQIFKAKNAGYAGSGFTIRAFTDTNAVKTAGSGNRKTAYASVFYHFDRRTEAYLAADYLKTTDGYKDPAPKGRDSQRELALGLRFRF